jgi:hypothetical protein
MQLAAVHESLPGTKHRLLRISEPGPLLGVELSRAVTASRYGGSPDLRRAFPSMLTRVEIKVRYPK